MRYIILLFFLISSFSAHLQVEMAPKDDLKSSYGSESARLFARYILMLNPNNISSDYNKIIMFRDWQVIDTIYLKNEEYNPNGFRIYLHRFTHNDKQQLDSIFTDETKSYGNFIKYIYLLNYDFNFPKLEYSKVTKQKDTICFQAFLAGETWNTKINIGRDGLPLAEKKYVNPDYEKEYIRLETTYEYHKNDSIIKNTKSYNSRRIEKEIKTHYDSNIRITKRETKQHNDGRILITDEYYFYDRNGRLIQYIKIRGDFMYEYNFSYQGNKIVASKKIVSSNKVIEMKQLFEYELLK